MVKCPYCRAELDELEAMSYEVNSQRVMLDEDEKFLDYQDVQPVDGSCTKMVFCCPLCGHILYSNNGNSEDDKVIQFLKTGNFSKSFVFR